MKRMGMLALMLLLGACATTPKPVGGPIPGSPGVQDAAAQADRVKGARVRWGGAIVGVQNEANDSVVEVVSRDLDDQGKPKSDQGSGGRFLARVTGFLDPEVYARGRLFSVTGTLADPISRNIGNYPYRYPVVNSERYHLWEQERPTAHYPPPYYDPFFDPWYPFYRPWPYYPYWP